MVDVTPVLKLSVNTFIRYYCCDPTKLVGEISRRMQQNSQGYDYYGILTDAIRAKIKGATDDEVNSILSRSSKPSEVSHNRAGYEVFLKKYGKKRGLEVFDRKAQLKLCGGELIVTASPVFSLDIRGEMNVFSLWASQAFKLDRTKAGVGVYLVSEAFRRTLPNYSYKIFDTVGDISYGTASNATASAVDSIARRIVELAKM